MKSTLTTRTRPAVTRRKKQKMKTENAEPDPDETPIGDLIWLYARNGRDEQFYSLLESLLDTEQFPTAIELLKLRTLDRIREDFDAIAVEGIGTHLAKLANALDHIDDYGIEKLLDA